MEEKNEVICSECGWTGDGKGLVSCPSCKSDTLTPLEIETPTDNQDNKYPEEVVEKVEEEKEENA